jgi:hypothetical protein
VTRRLQLIAACMVVAHRTNGEPYPFDPAHLHPARRLPRPRSIRLTPKD